MRPKIKICGMTRPEDALLAESLGADFIGVIFTARSKRCVTAEQARAVTAVLTRAQPVGVFVEQTAEDTLEIAQAAGLAMVQHAAPFPPGAFPLPVICAGSVSDSVDEALYSTPGADFVLLDTAVAGMAGGTGKGFDWNLIPRAHLPRTFIAGGIGPHNIAAALACGSYAVDLSSGVETTPGIKDPVKLETLFKEARHAPEL